MCFEIVTFYM